MPLGSLVCVFHKTVPSQAQDMVGPYHMVTSVTCKGAAYTKDCEDKALVGLLLHVKHGSGAAALLHSSGGRQVANAAKQGRFQGQAPYDRIFTFADLNAQGRCFVMFSSSAQESGRMLKTCGELSVGDVVVIPEPDQCLKDLGPNLPCIEYSSSALSLLPAETMSYPLKTTPYVEPNGSETCYFAYDNVSITMTKATFDGVTASCKGLLCDRQVRKESPNQKCGCLFMERSSTAYVLQSAMYFDTPACTVNENGVVKKVAAAGLSVAAFRSWRFTNLFMPHNGDMDVRLLSPTNMRKALRAFLRYVNDNGGWRVVGWCRCGLVEDASGVNGETIDSNQKILHAAYVYPSNPALVDTEEFKSMQFKPYMIGSNGARVPVGHNVAAESDE